MPVYAVRVQDSKGKSAVFVTEATSSQRAKLQVRRRFRSTVATGMGGSFRPVARVTEASRVPDDTPRGWLRP